MEWTPLHLTSLTRNKVDKDKREQQVARMEFKALPNNSLATLDLAMFLNVVNPGLLQLDELEIVEDFQEV